jgi:hypothetical protein
MLRILVLTISLLFSVSAHAKESNVSVIPVLSDFANNAQVARIQIDNTDDQVSLYLDYSPENLCNYPMISVSTTEFLGTSKEFIEGGFSWVKIDANNPHVSYTTYGYPEETTTKWEIAFSDADKIQEEMITKNARSIRVWVWPTVYRDVPSIEVNLRSIQIQKKFEEAYRLCKTFRK